MSTTISPVEVRFLPAAWIAAQRELEARDAQLAILNDTLERMLAAGAGDAVIESLLAAIDAIDAAAILEADAAESAEDYKPAEADAELEADDSDRGVRAEVIAHLRAEGYVGAGFDALVTLYHRDLAELEYLRAESDCRGHMVRTKFQARYSARRFWFCNERILRRYASEEMLEWFDKYGRLTRAQLRANLLGRQVYAGSGYLR